MTEMDRNARRLTANIIEIAAGAVLLILGCLGIVEEFWTGMGTALLIVGGLLLIRQIRYRTNAEYKEKQDIEMSDERNRYIAMKAWSWAGYLFVLLAAVGTIVMKIMGQETIMMVLSGSVCAVLIFYWVSYMILKRKY